MSRPKQPLEERFWKKVRKGEPDECWLWTGAKNTDPAYGRIGSGVDAPKYYYAHRLSYILHKGEIKGGLDVMHQL